MNNHKMACVFLMVLIAALVYGTQEMNHRAGESRQATEDAKAAAESAALQRQIAETNLIALETKTAELRKAYREWRPHFERVRSPQEGEQRIADFVRQGGVFLISQRFDLTQVSDDKTGAITRGLTAQLVFEDDYVKTLNWLGKFEEAFPGSRVNQCRLIRGERGNNIRLELKVVLPILNAGGPAVPATPPTPTEVASS